METRILRANRALHGLRQRDLGRLIGRSQSWVSMVEKGKILPQPEEALKIDQALRPTDDTPEINLSCAQP